MLGPGWIGIVAVDRGDHDDLRQFRGACAAKLEADACVFFDRARGLHPGGRGRGQRLEKDSRAAAAVLYYLIVYAFANVGAFAAAAWLVRDKNSDNIDDLNGLGYQEPLLAICILMLMLSLIGIPPLAGFFGKLYVFMEALNQTEESQQADQLDLAGGARAFEFGGLGVLLRARAQGDVPACRRAKSGSRPRAAESPCRSCSERSWCWSSA